MKKRPEQLRIKKTVRGEAGEVKELHLDVDMESSPEGHLNTRRLHSKMMKNRTGAKRKVRRSGKYKVKSHSRIKNRKGSTTGTRALSRCLLSRTELTKIPT